MDNYPYFTSLHVMLVTSMELDRTFKSKLNEDGWMGYFGVGLPQPTPTNYTLIFFFFTQLWINYNILKTNKSFSLKSSLWSCSFFFVVVYISIRLQTTDYVVWIQTWFLLHFHSLLFFVNIPIHYFSIVSDILNYKWCKQDVDVLSMWTNFHKIIYFDFISVVFLY